MKAEITKEGYIKVSAETITEAFAMRALMPIEKYVPCQECGQMKVPMLFSTEILTNTVEG